MPLEKLTNQRKTAREDKKNKETLKSHKIKGKMVIVGP